MTSDHPLVVDRPADGVVRARLNRPAVRNALDVDTVAALAGVVADPGAAVVVLGSTTAGVFCSGADRKVADAERRRISDDLYDLYGRMLASPSVVVAAVDGPAVGGGAQLLLASDVVLGSPGARVRFAGVGHGLAVGSWRLPRVVGRVRAMELCLSMRDVEGTEAAAIGLFSRLVEDPDAEALALARHVAALDPDTVARLKAVTSVADPAVEALGRERTLNADRWDGSVGER